MKLLQIATTLGQPCGVGNFARALDLELRSVGIEVRTQSTLALQSDADIILLHHEWCLLDHETVQAFCRQTTVPVVLFAHSLDVSTFDGVVAAYIAMDSRITAQARRPALVWPHPAYAPHKLENRRELRRRFHWPEDRVIVGTSGFLLESRSYPWFVENLIERAVSLDFFICLMAPKHAHTSPPLQARVEGLAEAYPDYFCYEERFLPREELNLRMQACDLLWCWTEVSNQEAYASGVASDMYGSGTRMVVCDKLQHAAVLELPNVVRSAPNRGGMLESIVAEIVAGHHDRHDPRPVGWPLFAKQIVTFLQKMTEANKGQPLGG